MHTYACNVVIFIFKLDRTTFQSETAYPCANFQKTGMYVRDTGRTQEKH